MTILLMRNKISAFLCVLLAVTSALAAPQKPGDETKSESSVWYNARHGDADAMNKVGVWYYTGNKVDKDYNQAYEWWLRGAKLQNAKAIANLGVCYQYGRGVERDSTEAIRLYLTAIESGQQDLFNQRLANVRTNTFDAMLIGLCYQTGIGTERNLKSAADTYAHAADKGSVDGMIAAGNAYMEYGDASAALKLLDKAATAGSDEAALSAAEIRINNMSNMGNAVATVQKLAEKGNAEAQTLLGQLYTSGNGVSADSKQAARWLKAAAEGSNAEAMWLYGNTLLADKDYSEALFWMSMAAQAGKHDDFNALLKRLPQNDGFKHYVYGMKAYIDGKYDEALQQFQAVGKSKNNDGKVMELTVLADYRNDKGNAAKAAKDLTKLAENNAEAAYVLAEMYLNGCGVSKDAHKAISLLRQAANAGYGRAQDTLATIYYDGVITPADRNSALDLYMKALRQHKLSKTGAQRLQAMYEGNAEKMTMLRNYNTTNPVKATLKALNK